MNVHAGGATGDPSALLHALNLASAGVRGLALHVIIVVVAASGANEEGGREQRRRAGTDFLHGRDIFGERRGVDKDLLVKPILLSAIYRCRNRGAAANGMQNGVDSIVIDVLGPSRRHRV